ncbi:hypothetical protein E2C01_042853 [Portunus trituberculatus]|uniref:Uncharacterized protein n=1 Tax=Portunus trituberculatus TaxID=210409 RepID=A0A5B7FVS0_PORTR|nr:hypothetical protein [Portunus trituberculatus]
MLRLQESWWESVRESSSPWEKEGERLSGDGIMDEEELMEWSPGKPLGRDTATCWRKGGGKMEERRESPRKEGGWWKESDK